jgi:hypothetical protein
VVVFENRRAATNWVVSTGSAEGRRLQPGMGQILTHPEGAGRPAAIRCGCFLPDLTKLANANVHPTPARAYGARLGKSQVIQNPFIAAGR